MDDLLIRGATLYDGSGADPIRADLAVRDGRIRAIAPSLPADAKQVIDADGLALMPGIIDSHTHFDAQLTWDPYVRPSPGARRDHGGDRQLRLHDRAVPAAGPRADDAQPDAGRGHVVRGAARGIRWEFETFAEYLAQLRRSGSAVNLAAYVGHSSLRTWVMGADANAARSHRRRDRADGRAGARGDGRRRGRPGQLHQPGAQRRRRRADAVAPGQRRRAPGADRGHGRRRRAASTW